MRICTSRSGEDIGAGAGVGVLSACKKADLLAVDGDVSDPDPAPGSVAEQQIPTFHPRPSGRGRGSATPACALLCCGPFVAQTVSEAEERVGSVEGHIGAACLDCRHAGGQLDRKRSLRLGLAEKHVQQALPLAPKFATAAATSSMNGLGAVGGCDA